MHRNIKGHTAKLSQIELDLQREFQPDRNSDMGGRSFYFFDLDDNVLFLPTPMYIFHKETGEEMTMSTGEFAQIHPSIGKSGYYEDFEIRACPDTGSYRRFRDFGHEVEPFEDDILDAIGRSDYQWKGPSWQCFYHAAFNQRPMSIITARGHSEHTIRKGLNLLHREGIIPHSPNCIAVFPVSNPETREFLGDTDMTLSIPELKRRAIFRSVELAMRRYGNNPYHRFGMSDDDPKNLELIRMAMAELKAKYTKNSFYVFSIHNDEMTKEEVFGACQVKRPQVDPMKQLSLLPEKK